jgi:hypothetical protein
LFLSSNWSAPKDDTHGLIPVEKKMEEFNKKKNKLRERFTLEFAILKYIADYNL